jgi:hypothetical protein
MEWFGPTAQRVDCRAWVDDAFALVDTMEDALSDLIS